MKVLQFILSLLIIIDFMEYSRADDGLNNIIAMKRPFCNAFTGCGRKRDPAYATATDDLQQLPFPLYRELLRLASARNAELRLRQRLGLDTLPELQPAPPRVALY